MKIFDLLEEVKLGAEEFKNKKNIEVIEESFDENIDDYKLSKVIKESTEILLNSKSSLNEDIFKNLFTCQSKIELIEEKTSEVTPVYAKMKFNSIKRNLSMIEESLKSKKISKSLNEDLLAYDLALIKTKMDELAEVAEIETYDFIIPLSERINKETETIKKIIG